MKLFIMFTTIFLCSLFTKAFAGNFYPVGKIGAKTVYSEKQKCESSEGQVCFDTTNKDIRYHDVVTSQVDDHTKPNFKTKYNVKSCDVQATDCTTKISAEPSDYCLNGDWIETEKNAIMPGFSYFCKGIIDYEQKSQSVLVLNSINKANVDASDAIKETEDSEIEQLYSNMAFGKKIKAMISIRNSKKGLTSTQIKQIVTDYSLINDLLSAGSITTAKEDITALVPDGVMIVQADKDAVLAEINAYLGL